MADELEFLTKSGVRYMSLAGITVSVYDESGVLIESYTSGNGSAVTYQARIMTLNL